MKNIYVNICLMTFQSFEKQFSSDTFKPAFEDSHILLSKSLKKTLNLSLLFHLFFIGLFFVEILFSFFLISSSPKSPYLAILLASIFLTIFTYLILRYYLQAKRPEQYHEMQNIFFRKWEKKKEHFELELPQAMDQVISEIDKHFDQFEGKGPLFPSILIKLNALFHWKECLKFKESLLFSSIRKQMQYLKEYPTDLDIHASLVNGFLSLSKLYKIPHQFDAPHYEIACRYLSKEEMQNKFNAVVERAIEELTILKEYIPHDPWVYAELAACYHDIKLPEKEISSYETLLELRPEDKEILYRLGVLYFYHGFTSKGLKIYKELLELDPTRAERLIEYYDSYLFEFEI